MVKSKTINVSLPDEMREFIRRRVDTGEYATVSDYLRTLVRAAAIELADRGKLLAELDERIYQAIENANGAAPDFSAITEEMRKELSARMARQI